MAADPNDPLYQLLLDEKIEEFNKQRAAGKTVDLRGASLRGRDLRLMNVDGLDMRDAYLRGADIRGVDFRNTQLEGASICEAKISGCFFPRELTAEEVRLSQEKGTRMRYRSIRIVKKSEMPKSGTEED
ncbi:MAG: pentapeptide repeat-containing protein [Gammaproteobacteria bacterium]|nr:pentapeptide repeat-containing protein [Gammaproteobacteria bacterium]